MSMEYKTLYGTVSIDFNLGMVRDSVFRFAELKEADPSAIDRIRKMSDDDIERMFYDSDFHEDLSELLNNYKDHIGQYLAEVMVNENGEL